MKQVSLKQIKDQDYREIEMRERERGTFFFFCGMRERGTLIVDIKNKHIMIKKISHQILSLLV